MLVPASGCLVWYGMVWNTIEWYEMLWPGAAGSGVHNVWMPVKGAKGTPVAGILNTAISTPWSSAVFLCRSSLKALKPTCAFKIRLVMLFMARHIDHSPVALLPKNLDDLWPPLSRPVGTLHGVQNKCLLLHTTRSLPCNQQQQQQSLVAAGAISSSRGKQH